MTTTKGASPYATGSGGVTFERKVAAQYLARLLLGDTSAELGEGRRISSVAFQQAPEHPADDLLVCAAFPEESEPSLTLALEIRRSVRLVRSNQRAQELILKFIRSVLNSPTNGTEYRLGLVVSGQQSQAEQLSILARHAAAQMDASRFFDLIRTPRRFDSSIRGRLRQLEGLVKKALEEIEGEDTGTTAVQERTWEMLSMLTVLMPRLEPPDDMDWTRLVNGLARLVPDADISASLQLRDRLVALASEYSPIAARVDLTMLRRDAHALLDHTVRRHRRGWQVLNHLHELARQELSADIRLGDGSRHISLNRGDAVKELVKKVSNAEAVVVSGESGVGKSALSVLELSALADADQNALQSLCINLRHIPALVIDLESKLHHPIRTLMCELSAQQRLLVIDGADAVTEDKLDVFRYLVGAAQASSVKVMAVTSNDSKHVVVDALNQHFHGTVEEHDVPHLSDLEIDRIVAVFPELTALSSHARSRELLRRLVVVDLLVRGGVSDVPLTDADAMYEVWAGLVRRRERNDRGYPQARELALLKIAELELAGGNELDALASIDPAALDGLTRDGLLRTSTEHPFLIRPTFAHDEIRRYAVARYLLASDDPAARLLQAGAPRWCISAASIVCQVQLVQPETQTTPPRGRFSTIQESFDSVVQAGHSARWGDVPGEALLRLADPEALLREAWPELRADNINGLKRLARLVDQRLRADNGFIDRVAVEPIILLLLEEETPWRSADYVKKLLLDWLRGHVVANTGEGDTLRRLLCKRLVDACDAADRRAKRKREEAAAALAARTPEEVERDRLFEERNSMLFTEIGYGGQPSRHRPDMPHEFKDETVLELLALLGPCLSEEGEAILCRVARDAPSWLAPAVEEYLTGRALASYKPALLAQLTEAYFIDDLPVRSSIFEDGIRGHHARSFSVFEQFGWFRGPFAPLLNTDFRSGTRVINRMLNHAARIRAQMLSGMRQGDRRYSADNIDQYETELRIAGTPKLYIGDQHVWLWYRGTGVGPYPCVSALLALERECDHLIEHGIPISDLVPILLEDCENLAMIGLVVGLIVRHLEEAENLLDSYLAEPLIWELEFARVVNEARGLAAGSEGIKNGERRKWSLRDAAMLIVARAGGERIDELRSLGETLVENARGTLDSAPSSQPSEVEPSSKIAEQYMAKVRAWASSLDRDRHEVYETKDGLFLQATPPKDVVQSLLNSNEELELAGEAIRLMLRYHIQPSQGRDEAIGPDDLVDDIATARKIHQNPPDLQDAWDTPALVAATALKAHIIDGVVLPKEVLLFVVEILLKIAEQEALPEQLEFEGNFFEWGADRSAARALPLFLLPGAAQLRDISDEQGQHTFLERAVNAGVNLARVPVREVRISLAQGLDHVWETPCAKRGNCHHEFGWQLAVESIRYCALSAFDHDTMSRSVLPLTDPLTESLDSLASDSIILPRLDAAIRALAPAAKASTCVSSQALDFLAHLLSAHRRALLNPKRSDPDWRSTHTLVSARALLTLASGGNHEAIIEHMDAYAENSALLGKFVSGLCAAGEEAECLAETARQVWPRVMRHVLELNRSNPALFSHRHRGETTLAALIPNAAFENRYLYREVVDKQIEWWDPRDLIDEVEAWLEPAAGNAICADQLVGFLRVLDSADQVRLGLPWLTQIVVGGAERASRSYLLPTWLVDMRSTAIDTGILSIWQELVDILVVHGVSKLASYSD